METEVEATAYFKEESQCKTGAEDDVEGQRGLLSTAELRTDAGLKLNADSSWRVAVQSKTAVEATA